MLDRCVPAVIPMYWWDGHPNFGDALTPWVPAGRGIVAVHTPLSGARAVGIGSLVDQLPDDFDGTIWGSGLLRDTETRLPRARFLAVRGPLTREQLGLGTDVTLGDPGLLVGAHARRRAPRWRLGVVPHGLHHADTALERLGRQAGVRTIDVRSTPSVVMAQIARCEAVLTTSLHGLIVADTLGIPAAWTQREPRLWGGDFKFRDYEAVVSPGRSRERTINESMDPDQVARACGLPDGDALSRSISELEASIAQLPVIPSRVWDVHSLRTKVR
ncbi:polysaccharide pyruvyl transferase family protein [Janibacter limosus]|uniref:Polysaccharide pyruvyl transferase family protein n=1 Tax=Janibacter limosus TaxID=53458 RepID=A0AC61U201_9MICO|nr:polysaccharide pyruvyl transferase family protein [Janibacter limosus]UUZ44042.1 polysaccharide pyruvyl transferase family protein [Janibacter limosus]